MSLKKFGPNDVFTNTMKAHPSCEFFIFDSNVYYNNIPHISGTLNVGSGSSVGGGLSVPITAGYVSLYELNIDRISASTGRFIGGPHQIGGDVGVVTSQVVDNGLIYPFITKDGTNLTWRTIATASNYDTDFEYGDVMSSSYPMSASITREYMAAPAGLLMTGDPSLLPAGAPDLWAPCGGADEPPCGTEEKCSEVLDDLVERLGWVACNKPKYRHYWALKSTLDSYGYMSEHYKLTASINFGTSSGLVIKDQQTINLISIPSIFYGSQIKPGSLSLKWYFTGSLAGELRDTKENGELIQVSGNSQGFAGDLPGTDGIGSTAGVVLYNEGFILLTGSWALNDKSATLTSGSSVSSSPSWIFFGAGANDDVTQATTSDNGADTKYKNVSFTLSFKGTTETQVTTMFANARRGKVNFSNNPTYLTYVSESAAADEDPKIADVNYWVTTSSYSFEEKERTVVNFVSSSAQYYSSSFERQVYISKIGVYDDNKNLIGIATLADPVRKEEGQDFTFKIKLDI